MGRKRKSGRRSRPRGTSGDALAPTSSSPPPAQSPSNSTDLLPPPQLNSKMPAQEMEEGEPSQQPRAGDPSPGIVNSSANNGVQVEEKENASANGGAQEEEEEEALKADLPASGPESTPRDVAAGKKKKDRSEKKKARLTGAAVRVWSVEDEFGILECLAAYVKANTDPPVRGQLPEVVRGHLVHKKEFTLTEIYEKVRRLRDRYYSMQATAAAGAPLPGDAEDLRKYELCAQIWAKSLLLPKREITENNGSHQAPETAHVRREFEELRQMYPCLTPLVEQIASGDRGHLKRAFESMDDTTARKLDDKVKKQRISEMKTQRDRDSLQTEVCRTFVKLMEW